MLSRRVFWAPIAFALAFALGSTAFAARTDPEYWRNAGVDLALFARFLHANDCRRPRHLAPCIAAVHAVAVSALPAMQIVTQAQVAREPARYAGPSRAFGPLRLVPVNRDAERARAAGLTRPQIASLIQADARAKTAAAEALLASREAERIDWNALIAAVSTLRFPPGDEGWIAGGAMNAYLGARYDPHTALRPAAQAEDMLRSNGESLVGAGVRVSAIGSRLVVIEAIQGSPAFRAGLFPEDEIVAIDGRPLSLRPDDSSRRILGARGTPVTLSVRRAGEPAPLTFRLVREPFTNPIVNVSLREFRSRRVGVLRLSSFAARNACDAVAQGILELRAHDATDMILDLRGNPGGLLEQAVCVAALFIGEGRAIVRERPVDIDIDGTGSATPLTEEAPYSRSFSALISAPVSGQNVIIDNGDPESEDQFSELTTPHVKRLPLGPPTPLVVLIDSDSASASELLAGALQDYAARDGLPIWIAGDRSYGKGTVQTSGVRPIPGLGLEPRLALAWTTARFYLPSGRTNQVVGVIPDISIPERPDASADELFNQREENLFTNALPPLVRRPWTQPRPAQASALQACVAASPARANYASAPRSVYRRDYALLAAGEIFDCLATIGAGRAGPARDPAFRFSSAPGLGASAISARQERSGSERALPPPAYLFEIPARR